MARKGRKTRSVTSNQRLRSGTRSVSYLPSAVPYTNWSTARLLSSPSYNPYQSTRSSIRYGRKPLPPRQPAPSRRADGGQPMQSAVRRGTRPLVSASPSTNESRSSMVCVRRSTRREVLHATNKTGKAGQKPPVYNWQSKIHCRSKK